MNNALSPSEITLLCKLLAEAAKDARDDLAPGEYKVNREVVLQVSGSVRVGEPYVSRIVAKADPWRLLAVAMSKLNGVTVEALVREAEDGTMEDETIKARADAAIASFKAPTETTCNGKVTTKGTIKF